MLSIIEQLRKNEAFSELYSTGMSFIYRSGLLTALKEFGRPVVGRNDSVTAQAYEAARAYGYQQCLDDLLYFRERYIDNQPEIKVKADYGGLDLAVERGDITEGERDAIRNGKYEPDISVERPATTGQQSFTNSGKPS